MEKSINGYAVHVNEKDNVATALRDIPKGSYFFEKKDGSLVNVVLKEDVRAGFKICIGHVRKGEKLLKYGFPIGEAGADLAPGDIVHINNILSKIW